MMSAKKEANYGTPMAGRLWYVGLAIAAAAALAEPALSQEGFSRQIQISRGKKVAPWTTNGGGISVVMTEESVFPTELWNDETSGTSQIVVDNSGTVIGDALPGNTPAIEPVGALLDYATGTGGEIKAVVAVWGEQGDIYFTYNPRRRDLYSTGNWKAAKRLDADGTDLSVLPAVAVSRELAGDNHSRYVHVVWWQPVTGRIIYCRGEPNASHTHFDFEAPQDITPGVNAGWPTIAAYKGTVLVLFTAIGSPSEVHGMRSTNNGDLWTSIGNISGGNGTDSALPDLAVDVNGHFHAVWNDTRSGGRNEVYYSGAHYQTLGLWRDALRISRGQGAKSQNPAVATRGDEVYVVWEDWAYNNAEVVSRHSPDDGTTWEDEVLLSDDQDDAHALVPDVACQESGEYVGVAWISQPTAAAAATALGATDLGDTYYSLRPWRPCTGICPSPLDDGFGGGLGGWTLQAGGGGAAGADSSDGYDEPPSLFLSGGPGLGSFARASSPALELCDTEPYSLIFRIKYVDCYQVLIGFEHVRLMLPSPSSEILYDPGAGGFQPLGAAPIPLQDLLPPGKWGRVEIRVTPQSSQFVLAVNGFEVGTGTYLPSLAPVDFFSITDTGVPGSSLTAWLDDFQVSGTGTLFSDEFGDCTLDGWTVSVANPPGDRFAADPAVYHATACGVSMTSQGAGYAYGRTPGFSIDTGLDYTIDFWFRIPDLNNHWFTVMDDGHVLLVIDYNDDLKSWDGAVAQLMASLNPGQWHHVRCDVHPSLGDYDVSVDGVHRGTAGFFTSPRGNLLLGDTHNGSFDHGAGAWDEIAVCGRPLPGDYALRVTTVGNGSVEKNPSRVRYDPGTLVELTAEPGEGHEFVGWSGDASGTANPLVVTMDRDREITATFARVVGAPSPGPIAEFDLAPVAPTPTPGTARIEFAVPRQSPVRLSVFDVQGREVARLAEGIHPAGRHRVTWDRKGAPAGVYLVRLEAEGWRRVRRLVLVR